MKVKWVRIALDDLNAAGEFITRDNPEAASRVLKRIGDAVQMLADHPHAGRAAYHALSCGRKYDSDPTGFTWQAKMAPPLLRRGLLGCPFFMFFQYILLSIC